MPEKLAPGLAHRKTIRVDERLTVPAMADVFSGLADAPPVFATAFMIALVEVTCVEAVRPYLGQGRHTVGTHVDVSHAAATPVGMMVTAEAELVEGRHRLRFRVACRDERGPIGEGFHERAIIDTARFTARASRKLVRS